MSTDLITAVPFLVPREHRHDFWMAKDAFGLWATPPWKSRRLLMSWLKRKYPKSWSRFTVGPIRLIQMNKEETP